MLSIYIKIGIQFRKTAKYRLLYMQKYYIFAYFVICKNKVVYRCDI